MGMEEVATILRKIWPYLLIGIGLGAVIHGWVPTDFFTTYAGPRNPFDVLVAVAIGVPLYSTAAGIMPLVEALYDKGLPMGTLLAFIMAVVPLSLPELILLRRVLRPPQPTRADQLDVVRLRLGQQLLGQRLLIHPLIAIRHDLDGLSHGPFLSVRPDPDPPLVRQSPLGVDSRVTGC